MRRFFWMVVLLALFAQGCAYNKQTLLKVNGNEVSVPLGPLEAIKGKGLRASLYRNVSIAWGKKEPIPEFKNISSADTATNGTHSENIDVK